jgi:hypothetical protein
MSNQDIATLHTNAERCWRQAGAATDPREKAAWVELAVEWTKLALDPPVCSEEAEQKAKELPGAEQDKLTPGRD